MDGIDLGTNRTVIGRFAEPKYPAFADMSSQQRSASLDNMARQIADLTAANNALQDALSQATVHAASEYTKLWSLIRMHDVVLRPTLLGRLRWLVLGR